MSLQDWVRNGWASQHKGARQEIQRLLPLADRDSASCATAGLAADWRFAIAYNSALQSATAALAAAGYRASHSACFSSRAIPFRVGYASPFPSPLLEFHPTSDVGEDE